MREGAKIVTHSDGVKTVSRAANTYKEHLRQEVVVYWQEVIHLTPQLLMKRVDQLEFHKIGVSLQIHPTDISANAHS